MFPRTQTTETTPWLVAWRQVEQRAWPLKRKQVVRHARILAAHSQEAMVAAGSLVAQGQFLFAISHAQLREGLANLVPVKRQHEHHMRGAMLGCMTFVAAEFVVLSSLGGKIHAHPIQAITCQSALSTWSQAYHKGRVIGCGTRRDWHKAVEFLSQDQNEQGRGILWAGPDHSLTA